MDLPLELDTRSGVLHVDTTADNSHTRLLLTLWRRQAPRTQTVELELSVDDVQQLAGTLLHWLVSEGHQLPELPAMDEDLEDADEDEPDDSQPPRDETGFGHLVVERTERGTRITQADPWVRASGELLDELAHRDTKWCTVRGLVLDLTDSEGRSCRYVVRPDLSAPSGTVVLQLVLPLAERLPAPDEHHRPHSRACGIRRHDHGPECSSNCPTCGGRSAQDQVRRSVIEQSPER